MSLLRKDGSCTIYQVEAQSTEYDIDPTNQYANWFQPNLPYVMTYPFSTTQLKDRPACLTNTKCWQKTGIEGFLTYDLAMDLFKLCQQYADGKHRYRVVSKVLSQTTNVLVQTAN